MKLFIALIVLFPFAAFAQTAPAPQQGAPTLSPMDALAAQNITPPSAAGPHICAVYYPMEAVRTGTSGTTIITFKITSQGMIAEVTVATSSGSTALDDASIACVAEFRYKPATLNGEPVEVPWKVRVNWSINNMSSVGAPVPRQHPAYLLTSPRAVTCFSEYPIKAREAGIEGKTTVHYTITTDGDVKDVSVTKSSGNADLDAATVKCSYLLRYEPAFADDRPIESQRQREVVWKLSDLSDANWKPGFATPPLACERVYPVKPEQLAGIDGTTELAFTIDKGNVTDVSVTHSSGNDDLDRAATRCVKSWRYEQAFKEGKPITFPGQAKIAWKDALKKDNNSPPPK